MPCSSCRSKARSPFATCLGCLAISRSFSCFMPIWDFYTGSVINYPSSPEYWFDGTKIYFDASQSMRARFMLSLEDNSAPTGGRNKVLRQFNEVASMSCSFCDLVRPTQSWADIIIIDSRWPQVQILAEGFFNVAAGTMLSSTYLLTAMACSRWSSTSPPTGREAIRRWLYRIRELAGDVSAAVHQAAEKHLQRPGPCRGRVRRSSHSQWLFPTPDAATAKSDLHHNSHQPSSHIRGVEEVSHMVDSVLQGLLKQRGCCLR